MNSVLYLNIHIKVIIRNWIYIYLLNLKAPLLWIIPSSIRWSWFLIRLLCDSCSADFYDDSWWKLQLDTSVPDSGIHPSQCGRSCSILGFFHRRMVLCLYLCFRILNYVMMLGKLGIVNHSTGMTTCLFFLHLIRTICLWNQQVQFECILTWKGL